MNARTLFSMLVVVLLTGVSYITPATTPTVEAAATCWVKKKTPIYQAHNRIVTYDHEIQCSKGVKEIVIYGHITWSPISSVFQVVKG